MTALSWRGVLLDGLWKQNPGLVQLLGLCPLLAVTTTTAYGLGLGVSTMLVLMCSNLLVSLTRRWIAPHIRIPVYVLIIAGLVTAIDILMQVWVFELHRVLGLFVPLIVTNCAIIARAEAFASRHSSGYAVLDGFAHGAGFAAILIVLGFVRELLGAGTVFADMQMLFGPAAAAWTIHVHEGFLLLILPPGAFFVLAALIAMRNALVARTHPATHQGPAPVVAPSS
ncbi:MAG: electron transport complex subunit E [Gammaproteobacteria bacterium]|nr:electron transport complex subunit E [Gammaproteobacteria bacterium]